MISIIIPVINEEENLQRLLPYLKENGAEEIIIVDGGSSDKSRKVAENFLVKVISSAKGRAKQMNAGVDAAKGEILYFVHADSLPPKSFSADILAHLSEKIQFGCFRSLFDTKNKFLLLNSYFSRFKGMMFRGGGQTLWITRDLYQRLNGYNESLKLMEEYDFIKRATKLSDYHVIQKDVLVSTRTYDEHGNFRTQLVYGFVMFGFFRGIHQDRLLKFAKYLLK
ncbi:TIGR04283 family arsenosugar biosynthesis glycosyltransferase [Mesonia aestuariivivens]|uniref:TIGR04283 family arsenosugar biosynthesis glycosyltransferase n=1 Tax=Mesonia aestuariivivens TaxID=2796128 RepID=A0ABS6W140_9FLAO|nr:TIGR04283 family arsenosugar biosynthesis glycosyltransferase [Mesonia aestuariivivens]MBW2961572.1 TIGR04283 family arsenosugar biosynthesis glycosyltransferase [Mesonia aestuariivivens]